MIEPVNSSSLGAMGSILRKLDELLRTEDRAQGLIGDLRIISTKLEKLSEVPSPPLTVKYWTNSARELSYDMEVCVDLLVHASQPEADPSAKEARIEEILGFKARVKAVSERCERYNLANQCVPCSNPTKTVASHQPDIVGMEGPTKKLLDWLMKPNGHGEDDLKLNVVSILGDEGVGKSTLVKRLWCYTEESSFEGKFDCHAFVHTAKKPDTRMVLRSILSQVRPKQPLRSSNVPELIDDLREHLQNKRYFIVIDDLWDVSVWHIVKRAFPDGKHRIITTTAVENVAHVCCSYDCNRIVNVKCLHGDQAKKIFVDRAFGPGKGCPPQLNDVTDKITRKCGGLPLAIICTATLVASQLEIKQEQQLDYVNNFLSNKLGTHSSSVEILNEVLKLCYSNLPHCLKTCLLYLSVYPENYLFLKEDLVKQWIAEDFICTSEGKGIAELAGSYFDELLSLGLIQRMDIINSKKKSLLSYTVHPVVFDFVICKSMEDNFVTIIDYSQSTVVLTEKVRRLSLHFGSAAYATTPASVELSQVRSLSFMGLLGCMPSIAELKLVRVMILHIQSDESDKRVSLAEIDKLILLRYLQVRCNVTVQLPVQVQCLKQLETLEINAAVANVPTDIIHHPSLQHVRIGRKIKHKSLKQDPVTSIEPIFPEHLSRKPLSAVQVLELLPPICSFSRLPGWMRLLTSLRILEVVVSKLGKYDLDHLGKLPLLTVLSLYVQKPDMAVVTFHTEALFPALECFNLIGVSLSFPEKAMPRLWKLKIRFNARRGERYTDMLHGIQHLSKLKEVVARIGVDPCAQESDMRAAESAYEKAISEHLSRLRSNLKGVDKVGKEYEPPESSTKQAGIPEKLPGEDSPNTTAPGNKDLAATALQSSAVKRQQSWSDVILHIGKNKVKREYDPPDSSNKRVEEVLMNNEIQNEDPKHDYTRGKEPQEGCTPNTPLGNKDLVPNLLIQLLTAQRRQSQNQVWRREGPDIHTQRMLTVLALEKLEALLRLYEDRDSIQSLCRELRFRLDDHLMERPRREWLQSYCDLAYDIEDWADNFTLSIPVAGGRTSGASSIVLGWFGRAIYMLKRLHARHELRDFLVRFSELRLRHIEQDEAVPLDWQDRFLLNLPSSLVGHNRPMEEVIEMLMKSRDMAGFNIISIVGMVGSGKTTLAAAVYQRVNELFDCCAFVYMGHQCDMVKILKGMLQQLDIKDQGSMYIFLDDVECISLIRRFLTHKRYLIMVDDLWHIKQWAKIQHCFPQSDHGSRIIITTMDDTLAMSLGSSECIYKIDLLSDADSEQLFLNEVCGKQQHLMNDKSAKTMKKCGGLPLAIVSEAAMLEPNQSEDESRRIRLKLQSISDKNYMWQRLNLIYNNLPHLCKPCILYLSIFPMHYEVAMERLMRLCIAEGFINKVRDSSSMEETARRYLDDLIRINMVLPLHVNHHGIPKCCTVHPVIHDFIVSKSSEENFVAIVNDQHQTKKDTYGTIRRLSLQSSSEKDRKVLQNTFMDLSRVRSIIVIGQACTVPDLARLRQVRVLDLEGCDVTTLCLDDLHKLQLLRYLSLRGTNVSELPETIGELRYLQTLDVRSTNVKELPDSIVRLVKLIHLLCGSAKLPPRIERMEMLQTLSCAITTKKGSTCIRDLSKLVGLSELELFCDFTQMPRDEKQVTFSHGGFGRLEKLCVRCYSASVAFEPDVLPMVQVLELSFEGPLTNETSAVSGIGHLSSLKYVLLEISQDDAGALKEAATELQQWNPEVTVTVDWRPLGSTST